MVLFVLANVLIVHWRYLVVCLGAMVFFVGYWCFRNRYGYVFECWCVL